MSREQHPAQTVPPRQVAVASSPPAEVEPGSLWPALAPFLLLFLAQLLSWAWHAAGAGGTVRELEPPTLVALALLAIGGLWAYRRGLPRRLYGWSALGLSAVATLIQAVIVTVMGSGEENAWALAAPAFVILVLALGTAVAAAGRGARHGVLFFVLFQAFPTVLFPIVRVGDFISSGEGVALTAASAAIAALYTGLLLWLFRRFLRSDASGQAQSVMLLTGLVLLHAAAARWILLFTNAPESAGADYANAILTWVMVNLLLLAVVYMVGRIRRPQGPPSP